MFASEAFAQYAAEIMLKHILRITSPCYRAMHYVNSNLTMSASPRHYLKCIENGLLETAKRCQ